MASVAEGSVKRSRRIRHAEADSPSAANLASPRGSELATRGGGTRSGGRREEADVIARLDRELARRRWQMRRGGAEKEQVAHGWRRRDGWRAREARAVRGTRRATEVARRRRRTVEVGADTAGGEASGRNGPLAEAWRP